MSGFLENVVLGCLCLALVVGLGYGCIWFLNFSWNFVFGSVLMMDYWQSFVFLCLLYFVGRVWS